MLENCDQISIVESVTNIYSIKRFGAKKDIVRTFAIRNLMTVTFVRLVFKMSFQASHQNQLD